MKRGPRRHRLMGLLGLALAAAAWWLAVAAAPAEPPRAAGWICADDEAWLP